MIPTSLRTAAALAVLGTLLAGCSAGSEPADGPTSSAAFPSSGDPQPAPSSTLTAEEQQAVEEATAVVLARQQTFYDLLADKTRDLNDINDWVTDSQLELDLASLRDMSAEIDAGNATIDSTGPVGILSVEPLEIDLANESPKLVLLVCVDRTSASGTAEGVPWTGSREQAQYRLVKTTYLPAPGWAVSRILPPTGYEQPQPC